MAATRLLFWPLCSAYSMAQYAQIVWSIHLLRHHDTMSQLYVKNIFVAKTKAFDLAWKKKWTKQI